MNIIIWLQPQRGGVEFLGPAVKILSHLYGNLDVAGMISAQEVKIDGVKIIDKQDLKSMEYDLILVAGRGAALAPILKEAETLGIDPDKIVLDRTVCVPFFTLEKYKKLRHSSLSIISMNCWAGIVYNRFGLPFLSPTINMFTSEEDFLKFLKKPDKSVDKKLKLQGMKFNPTLNINYPIFKIDKTEWFMNHYDDPKVANAKWIERSKRINWFNLLVVMYTENPDVLAEFDKLPYSKKVCIVPFKTNIDSGYYVDPSPYNGAELWQLVNGTATGSINIYDMWDMLLYGKKTLIKRA